MHNGIFLLENLPAASTRIFFNRLAASQIGIVNFRHRRQKWRKAILFAWVERARADCLRLWFE